jgi:hypothetical protein
MQRTLSALCAVVVMVVLLVVLLGGECRQGCAQQQDTGQYGDQRFLQRVSSSEHPSERPLCF